MQKHAFLVTYSYSSDPQAPLRALKPPRIGGRESLPPPLNIPQPNSANVIQIPIDHFGHKTSATFSNRYWLNATYYKSGGPVFLFDSGEQNAEPLVPYYIQEYHGLSAVMRLAKRYNGLALLWEHRFYGESLPFPVNGNTTSEQWQFLNTEQALEDIVFFANSFAQSELSADGPISSDPLQKFAVHPSKTPWIMLGGSYPGIRSALMRIRNPSVIFASWASSAPVQAQVDMSSYYKAAERSMTRNCSADWVAVTKYVDDTLSGSNETALLKAHLSGPGGNTTGNSTSNVNAASQLLKILQYYGFKDSILPFCNILESQNRTAEPVEGGVVAQFGIDIGFKSFLTAISEVDYAAIPGDPDDPVQDRSWMWQYCSEYDPNNPLSIETSFLSLELFQQQCDETFPKGWKMNPSNVMFSNGEFDPWRTMGLASIESNAPNRKPSVSVPACNTPASSPSSFFGITYDNMVHVSDMRVLITPDANHSDFKTVGFYSPVSQEPFFTGLGLFQLAMDEWLPCFGR
ncbi:serine carboxypeptidase S28-domain-containing protein [Gymnopilus junonius]|uniref:Serine carboxypeptidase S28-domain-containing protein n=1 Tax=Gymnopilus junonius TaxID=109634 RepID=A0A9P5NFB5_GYMJU|nr:serine carboxypeptidase S28-domain-containing protein [Gymnopilus junonius]